MRTRTVWTACTAAVLTGCVWLASGAALFAERGNDTLAQAGTRLLTEFSKKADSDKNESKDYVQVEVRGRLKTGIVAIGGETTGTTITANNITFELDLGNSRELYQQAQQLSGQTALVQGTLEKRKGVEIGERWIVHVKGLKQPGEDEQLPNRGRNQ